jgi:hypothetical protein
MKQLENYVCTLTQAKRLKELGIEQDSFVEQNSLFYFTPEELTFDATYEESQYQKYNSDYEGIIITTVYLSEWDNSLSSIPAFTSQELEELIVKELGPFTTFTQSVANESMFYFILSEQNDVKYNYDSEAHARAEFLIYLLEQKK